MAATAQDLPLNQQSAVLGLQMLRSAGEALRYLIKRAWAAGQPNLDFAVTQHLDFFDSIAYVRCDRRGWRCTCSRQQCTHSANTLTHTHIYIYIYIYLYFCKSLTLAGRPAEFHSISAAEVVRKVLLSRHANDVALALLHGRRALNTHTQTA